MDLTVREETFVLDRRDWLDSEHGTDATIPITLDLPEFAAYAPNGFIPSGIPLARLANKLVVPYGGITDEVQSVTEGGSGLTSFTLTFSGSTTAAILAAATAAQVQAALEALPNIGAGNVKVTGNNGGPYTVVFGGDLADENVAQMTATPTGGTGTVTVATVTAGGTDPDPEQGVCIGHLYAQVKINAGSVKAAGALLRHGFVKRNKLPYPIDANGEADVAGFIQYRTA